MRPPPSSATSAVPALMAVDWGTSSFRAFLTSEDGDVLDAIQTASGILRVENGQFAPVLQAATALWMASHGNLPVLMSGMIGSRQGWVETAYQTCPGNVAGHARALHPLPEALTSPLRVAIVPGVVARDAAGRPDVMRGEETQIFGALERLGINAGTFVLPGTHSKWVTVADGAITGFSTYMTGEVFAALKDHTILGRLMPCPGAGVRPASGTGFTRGVAAAAGIAGGPGALLRLMFSARSLGLFAELAPEDIADYLSGLLIGSEIRDAAGTACEVVVIASDELAARYGQAFRSLGIAPLTAPADCAAAGLAALARHAGMIGSLKT